MVSLCNRAGNLGVRDVNKLSRNLIPPGEGEVSCKQECDPSRGTLIIVVIVVGVAVLSARQSSRRISRQTRSKSSWDCSCSKIHVIF